MLRRLSLVVIAVFVTLLPLSASGQTQGEVRLSTPFPGIIAEPGSTASFTLAVDGRAGAQAPLTVRGLPAGWTATFRGDGTTVDRVSVSPSDVEQPELRLDIAVPGDASDGTNEFTAAAGSSTLDLAVTVKAGAAGAVTLTPDFPGLRGPTDGDFTFNVSVSNETSGDVNLQLAGSGPQGWDVTAEPSGQAQASVITVAAGQAETVNLTAVPPTDAEAGVYDIGMTATGEGVDVNLAVQVELIGNFSLDLTTIDQRLNSEVTVGSASELQVVVINTGTAPLVGVQLSATPPSDWEVTMTPEVIDQILPGETATATATISASSQALAGDYDIAISANSDQASDSMSIRTTVTPSATWGIVGVGLIALTLAGLAMVFRRFGRR